MPNYTAGTAYLRIAPSMRTFPTDLRRELNSMRPEPVVKIRAVVDDVKMSRVPDQTVKVRADVDKASFSQTLVHVAALGRAMATLAVPVGLAASIPTIAGIGSAALSTTGALGLIPAAAAGAALGIGTLTVGLSNMADALGPTGTPAQLKKVNEALAELAPNARAAVMEIRGLGPAWSALRLDVQQQLFRGVASEIGVLGRTYLPVLRTNMVGLAKDFNAAGVETTRFFGSAATARDMSGAISAVRAETGSLAGVMKPLAQIITDVFVVGAQEIRGWGGGLRDITVDFAAFVRQARESGQLAAWIHEGAVTLMQLGSIVQQVGAIFYTVFKAADAAGVSTLDTIQLLLFEVRTFLSSADGQTALVTLFTTIGGVVRALLPGLQAVAIAIAQGIVAIGPSLPGLATAFSDVAIAVAPLIPDLAKLVAVILPPLAGLISAISPALGPMAAGFVALLVVTRVATAFDTVNTALRAYVIAQYGMVGAAAIGTGVLAPLRAAVLALNAAFLANPIGIVVLALIAVGAALVFAYNHFEGFRKVVDTVFAFVLGIVGTVVDFFTTTFTSTIPGALRSVVDFFTGPFSGGISSAISTVVGFFTGPFVNGISAAVDGVVSFFVNLPSTVAGLLAALGTWLVGAARTAFWALVTGAQEAGAATLKFFAELPRNIAYGLGFLVGTLTRLAIEGGTAFLNGIVTGFWAVIDFFVALPGRIAVALVSLALSLAATGANAMTAMRDGIVTAAVAVYTWFQELPARVTSYLINLGSSLAATGDAALKSLLSAVIVAGAAVIRWFEALPGVVVGFFTSLAARLTEQGSIALNGLLTGIVTGAVAVYAWFINLPSNIANFFTGAGTWLLQVGADILNGLVQGLVGGVTAVIGFFSGLITSFVDGFKAGLGIASPSTVFAEIGGWILQGLLNGLTALAQMVLDFIVGFAGMMVETFRAGIALVEAVWSAFWNGLVTVATFIFDSVRAGIEVVFGVIESIFGLKTGSLSAIWNSFWSGVQAVGAAIFEAVRAGIELVWSLISFLWTGNTDRISAAWSAFWAAVENVGRVVFEAIRSFLEVTWAVISANWSAVTSAIGAAWSAFWANVQLVGTTIFNAIRDFVNVTWSIISGLWSAAMALIRGDWQGFWDNIYAVGRTIMDLVTGAVNNFTSGIQTGFQWVVDQVTSIWNGMREALAAPIRFMIETVFNNGIVPAWNWVADLLPGIDPISPLPVPLNSGGKVPGFGYTDTVPAVLTPGEFVVRKQVAEPITPFLRALNEGDPDAMQAAGGGRIRRYAAGGPVEVGLDWAKSQVGKPYIWGGVGPAGYDCSGFMSAIANVLTGRNPHSRIGSTGSAPWGGWSNGLNSAFGVGYFKGSPGHMAGTLGGVNVESSGGVGVRVGNGRGARDGMFTGHMSLPQVGGEFVGGASGGGGFFNWILEQVRNFYNGATGGLVSALRGLIGNPPPRYLDIPPDMAQKVINDVGDFLFGQATTAGGGPNGGDVSGITGPVQSQVQQVAANFGWGSGPEWAAIVRLVQKESSWNPNAANPTSSARGLFQKMTSIYGPVEPTPAGQAQWGLNYVKNRYGTPVKALAFHDSRNWYDRGGVATGRGIMMKNVLTPERVLDTRQNRAFETLVGAVSGRSFGTRLVADRPDQTASLGGPGAGPFIGSLTVPVPDGSTVDDTIDTVMVRARHESRGSRYSRP